MTIGTWYYFNSTMGDNPLKAIYLRFSQSSKSHKNKDGSPTLCCQILFANPLKICHISGTFDVVDTYFIQVGKISYLL